VSGSNGISELGLTENLCIKPSDLRRSLWNAQFTESFRKTIEKPPTTRLVRIHLQ
jgi:hypothetical protein